ncbi:hypothetical protein [Geodermatophilus sp. URMC 63]
MAAALDNPADHLRPNTVDERLNCGFTLDQTLKERFERGRSTMAADGNAG